MDERGCACVVRTLENQESDPTFYTWPCAPVLAEYVYYRREFVRGRKVLELGAGTAVCGVVAAKCGAHVTLTDRASIRAKLRQSCRNNGLDDVKVETVNWGVFSPSVLQMEPPDIILASDCLYCSSDFEDIFAMSSYFMEKKKSCQLWTSYQERSSNRCLEPLLQRWNLQSTSVVLESFWSGEVHVEVEGKRQKTIPPSVCLWSITRAVL